MNPELHRYLDGELPREALSPAAAAELTEWESLETALVERRGEQAPPWLTDDVMRALPAPREPAWRRAWSWLVTPRPIHIPPFAPLAAAALVVLLFGVRGFAPAPAPTLVTADGAGESLEPAGAGAEPVVYVQFVLNAAGARTVSVAGDFNEWSAELSTLRDVDGDGVWTGLVPVRPGVHKYMFVIDGQEWVTDPKADSYVDDDFGMRNALLAIATPEATL